MSLKPKLRVVKPDPVSINDLMREEAKARDWSAVHIAGDRNPPLSLWMRPWRWSLPISRKKI